MVAFIGALSLDCSNFSSRSRHISRSPNFQFPRVACRLSVFARLENPVEKPPRSLQVPPSWDALCSDDFNSVVESNHLPLCLVGMSNCGKSHWSSKLATECGFMRMCVDDEIERAIEPELTSLGYAGIADMARWMGYPSDDRYRLNEARYLEIEERVTSQATPPTAQNFVLDTTGSVVYLSSKTLGLLRKNFFIVHLAADESVLEEMRRSYFESPKPVVWSDAYNQLPNESSTSALRRCYEHLLRERLRRYEALAHVSIPASFAFSGGATVDQLLDFIRDALDRSFE